jgi:hypothetical protein
VTQHDRDERLGTCGGATTNCIAGMQWGNGILNIFFFENGEVIYYF